MTVKMILAVDRGGSIGWADGRLPWKIKSDLQRFKTLTSGHTILMGSKTAATLPPAGLPNRQSVILTRDKTKETAHNVNPWVFAGGDDPLAFFIRIHQACLGCWPADLWIIGGAQIYAQALEQGLVDEIHLTIVDTVSGADIVMPGDLQDWKLFIIRQRNLGINWELVEATQHPRTETEPATTYLRLVKQ